MAATVRDNTYRLNLDTFEWDLPIAAQMDSPSRQKHASCFDPIFNRVVSWGGMRHHTIDQVYPRQTLLLRVPAPVQPEDEFRFQSEALLQGTRTGELTHIARNAFASCLPVPFSLTHTVPLRACHVSTQ